MFGKLGTVKKLTSPVGGPPAPVTVAERVTPVRRLATVTGPVPPLTLVVVVVAVNVAVGHLVARFATFSVPKPVARSYPAAVVNAGTAGVPVTSTVVPPPQNVEPVAQGTEFVPLVTS